MSRGRAALALAAVLAVLAPAAEAGSSAAPLRVQGIERIGSFGVRGGLLGDAVRAFGRPSSAVEQKGACLLTWSRLGVRMRFYTLVRDPQCAADSAFESAGVSGPWVTDRGLGRGDALSRVRRLYPGARRQSQPFPFQRAGTAAYGLVIRSQPAIGEYGLAVEIRGGRAASLLVLYPQGGE